MFLPFKWFRQEVFSFNNSSICNVLIIELSQVFSNLIEVLWDFYNSMRLVSLLIRNFYRNKTIIY